MPDMPRTKFNSPWTVANIEAELNGTKNARGALTMTEKLAQKVETSTYATDKAALDAEIAEDRAALVELVDCGAKNRLPLTGESTDIFTINADGTMTANGPSSTSKRDFTYYVGAPPKGRFVFSGCPPTGSNTTYRMFLQSVVGSTYTTLATLTGDPVEVDLTNIDKIRVLMSIYGGYTPNNIKFSPMLCTKAEWDISQKFVPYCPTNRELYEDLQTKVTLAKVFGRGVGISNNDDLNTYQTLGRYCASNGTIAASLSNCPVTTGFVLTVTESFQTNGGIVQTIETLVSGENQVDIYKRMRIYRNNAWAWVDWNKYSGTVQTRALTMQPETLTKGEGHETESREEERR